MGFIMALIKKNIWTLFYIIFFIGIVILSTIIYYLSSDIQKKYKYEQENITKISANSVNSVFLQYEMILNILGNELTLNNNYKSEKNSQEILDNLNKLNPSIIGFFLYKPNGEVYLTNSNIDISKLKNLLTSEETKETFEYTLNSNKMIIGRTFFVEQFNKFVIPIRKTIRDKDNKVMAVMTAGIDVNSGFDFFLKNQSSNSTHETFLFRDSDYYFQIAQSKHSKNKKIYEYAIPKEIIDNALQNVISLYNTSIENIKENGIITTVNSNDKRNVLASSVYLKDYRLWLVTQIPLKNMYYDISLKAGMLIILYFLVFTLLYYLFRYIDNYEKTKQEILYYQATHDDLTKLYNRFYVTKEFTNLKKDKPFSLFFIDMDNFRSINDNYGHINGDLVLKQVTKRLISLVNKKDILIRYSGDEFILISSIIDKEEIEKLASIIIEKLSVPFDIKQYEFRLSASIGIALFPKDAETFDEIKRYADISLAEAKKNKNTYKIFEKSIKDKYLKQFLIESELKKALQNNEIYMMYQPQINKDGNIYGVEALVRWENKELGFVPPDIFIPIAESSGMMKTLGVFIIEKSLYEIENVYKNTNLTFQLSINISVKQFMEKDFYENLFKSINRYKLIRTNITLEVTENVFIEDLEFIISLLNRLKKHGIKISLDDFGTGYSSLSLLKRLPIDELKIDKSFVDDILIDQNSLSMVEDIISIGKKQNMVILAEGVESKEQKELLQNSGCNLFQGYYYSKPLKIDDLKLYLDSNMIIKN